MTEENVAVQAQIERLRAAVDGFRHAYGRVPTVIFEADGVIYDTEEAFRRHYAAAFPSLEPVVGALTLGCIPEHRSPEVAAAVSYVMRRMDWTAITLIPRARDTIEVLLGVGLDLSVATAHRLDNGYSPAAKVHRLHQDFDGLLDTRVQIGIDKTRCVGDWLIDAAPERAGALAPQWEHLPFTANGGSGVRWETMVTVLAALIEETLLSASTKAPKPEPGRAHLTTARS